MRCHRLTIICLSTIFFSISSCTLTHIGTTSKNYIIEPIEVYKEKLDEEVRIYIKNNTATPYSVKFDLTTFHMSSSRTLKEPILIRPNSRALICQLKAINDNWNYNYTWKSKIGNYKARHNDDYVYLLPYTLNSSFKVIQGFNGKISHKNIYAIDFAMPIGTRIRAIRQGKVIEIKEDSNIWCSSTECEDYGNFIRIEHEDKSIAQYYHLMFDGVDVNVGQQIEKGQFIGRSGNTGYTRGPHLHIEVLKPRFDDKPSGIEIKFQTQNGVQILEEGQFYIAQ